MNSWNAGESKEEQQEKNASQIFTVHVNSNVKDFKDNECEKHGDAVNLKEQKNSVKP